MRQEYRKKIKQTAVAVGIFLLITIGYPIAVDQKWVSYNPYILPTIVLVALCLFMIAVLHSDFAYRTLGNRVLTKGGLVTLATFMGIGALSGVGLGAGYYWLLLISKTHINNLLSAEKISKAPQPPPPAPSQQSATKSGEQPLEDSRSSSHTPSGTQPAPNKKKPDRHDAEAITHLGGAGVNVQQSTTGNNSPIVNSPITVNPPVNPLAPVIYYDFNGVKHTQIGNRFSAEAGEQSTKFQEMGALEKQKKWDELRQAAESQISATPLWLTPYLFASEAYANLGNKSKAIELCEFVKSKSGGNQNFDRPADILLNNLRK